MRSLLSAEVLKLRTVPLPRIVLLVALAGSALLGHAVVRIAVDTDQDVRLADLVAAVSQPLFFLAVVVAVVATAGEFHHRTVRTTLLQAPRRGQLAAATALTSCGYGAMLALLGAAAALLSGGVTMSAQGLPVSGDGVAGALAALVGIGAGWAALGAGLGMLTRSTTVSIVTLLLWKLVLEGIVPAVTQKPDLAAWLPGAAADAVLLDSGQHLSPSAGALLFAGYAVAVLLAGAAVLVRHDPA